jgi:hypothetical protein
MTRWGRFAAAYAVLGALAVAIGAAAGRYSPFEHPEPWLTLDARSSHGTSALLGLGFGLLLAVGTRALVPRFRWAERLHVELRPIAQSISGPGILVLALLSSLGEELLFRGLLQPWLGLILQSALFGLLHQIRGPSRWVWVGWASAVGLALGAMFQLTGSLVGPVIAHAVVNFLNLSYLKSYDPTPQRRALGGLLGQRG